MIGSLSLPDFNDIEESPSYEGGHKVLRSHTKFQKNTPKQDELELKELEAQEREEEEREKQAELAQAQASAPPSAQPEERKEVTSVVKFEEPVENENNDGVEVTHGGDFIDQIRKESEEMWITNLFVESPCKVMLGGYAALIILAFLAISFGYFEVDDGESGRDFLIWNDPIVLDYTMLVAAEEFAEDNVPPKDEAVRSEQGAISFILFTNEDDSEYGLLQKETL